MKLKAADGKISYSQKHKDKNKDNESIIADLIKRIEILEKLLKIKP